MKTWDKVLLCIGSDSYDETVEKVSASWIITVDGKRFKKEKVDKILWEEFFIYKGMWDDHCYRVYDNSTWKLKAHLDPSF